MCGVNYHPDTRSLTCSSFIFYMDKKGLDHKRDCPGNYLTAGTLSWHRMLANLLSSQLTTIVCRLMGGDMYRSHSRAFSQWTKKKPSAVCSGQRRSFTSIPAKSGGMRGDSRRSEMTRAVYKLMLVYVWAPLTLARWASSISRRDSVALGSGLTVTAITLEFTTVWFLKQTKVVRQKKKKIKGPILCEIHSTKFLIIIIYVTSLLVNSPEMGKSADFCFFFLFVCLLHFSECVLNTQLWKSATLKQKW